VPLVEELANENTGLDDVESGEPTAKLKDGATAVPAPDPCAGVAGSSAGGEPPPKLKPPALGT
jgi:hypothetical protein